MSTVKDNAKLIAGEILKQLGGHKFLVMTGAHNLLTLADGNGLAMKLRRNSSKANYLRISVNSLDLYDIEFIKIWGNKLTTVEKFENVYNDRLVSTFESVTGMKTILF